MTDAATEESSDSPKAGKAPLLVGLALAALGGTGGFYAVHQGLILSPESNTQQAEPEKSASAYKDIAFVPLEPLSISLPRASRYQHLRFRGELEVSHAHEAEVQKLVPRIIDVLNSYLRAVEVSDLEDASALTRLRSQMLRRAQIVTGPGRIDDLLIMEFVLN
ncbi:MAG: flagellar basal body-associated FliL family protein [Roseobacter sp.]|jgi:flagellar FliL protein